MQRPVCPLSLVIFFGLLSGCMSQTISVLPSAPAQPEVHMAPQFKLAQIRSVAVLPFDDPSPREPEYVDSGNPALGRVAVTKFPITNPGQYVQRRLENALVSAPFLLVERDKTQKILDEQDLASAMSGTETARTVGRIVGADAVLLGGVEEFLYISTYRKYLGGGFLSLDIPVVTFSVRLVDVETGRVLWTYSCSDTGTRFLREKYTVSTRDVLADPLAAGAPLGGLDRLAREMMNECVSSLLR